MQDKTIKRLEKELEEKEEERILQTEELKEMMAKQKDDMENEIGNVQQKLSDINHYQKEKEERYEEIKTLKKKCEDEKKLRLEQVNEKERDRIKETEQLRKEMLQSIKKTKANLLALNDEQLQTTTRLTILQNH